MLKNIVLPIVNDTLCQKAYHNLEVRADLQFCAGGGEDGKDACGGDAGGPLMVTGRQGNVCTANMLLSECFCIVLNGTVSYVFL